MCFKRTTLLASYKMIQRRKFVFTNILRKKKNKDNIFCSRFTLEEINQLGMLQKILKMSQRTLCLANVFKISMYQNMEIDILLFSPFKDHLLFKSIW